MLIIRKYSIIVILTLTIVVGIFNNIPIYAQEGNQTLGEENQYNKTTTTVRDSVTILLQNTIIPGTDFLHL